jgi:hypothetical protein
MIGETKEETDRYRELETKRERRNSKGEKSENNCDAHPNFLYQPTEDLPPVVVQLESSLR